MRSIHPSVGQIIYNQSPELKLCPQRSIIYDQPSNVVFQISAYQVSFMKHKTVLVCCRELGGRRHH